MLRRALPLILPALLFALPTLAQDEDLAPLTPAPKAKAKPKPKPKAKPAKPAPEEDLAPLTPASTRATELAVKVSGDVQGAKLFIDGKEIGVLPQGPQEVSAGEHTVAVKRPGFAAFSKKVQAAKGKTVEVTAALVASAAVLSVSSDAPNAQVLINGKMVGNAPIEELELPAGTVSVLVRKEGYVDWKQDLVLRAGKDYPLSARLQAAASAAVAVAPGGDRPEATHLAPEDAVSSGPLSTETSVESSPPVVTRWYFWVGVVAVAGAIAAGTAIGVSQANAAANKPLTAVDICGEPCPCLNCAAGVLKF